MQNLTGVWKCTDNGTYYVTQLGNNLYLSGSNDSWYNVGFGIINPDEETVVVSWTDTPRSCAPQNHGVALLNVSEPGRMIKVSGSQNFGYGNFTKQD